MNVQSACWSLARAATRLAAVAAVASACAGCFSFAPRGVRFASARSGQQFTQDFPAAIVNRGPGGDYHVVLLRDGTGQQPRPEPGSPLPPLELAPVRQVVHVHVFWRPMRGAKPDNPSATNAAVDWYLVRAGEDGRLTGLAHYQGAGLVDIDVDGDEADVVIRAASLKPAKVEGDIAEPLGDTRLVGRFDARHDPGAVDDVLAQLDRLESDGVAADVDPVRLTQPTASVRAK